MRLIDADALVAQEEFFAKIFKGDFGEQVATHVIEVINDAPTVDAIHVRHGRWLCKRYGVAFDGKRFPFWTIAVCSECNKTSCDAGDYCPNCGAKMDEERKEE